MWKLRRMLSLSIVLLFMVGCDRPSEEDRIRATRRRAAETMQSLCAWIYVLLDMRESPPPLTPEKLIEWMDLTPYTAQKHLVDAEEGVIRDAWDRPVVLIAHNGKLWALGSYGPNGKWDKWGDDDIVVPMPGRDDTQSSPTAGTTPSAEGQQ